MNLKSAQTAKVGKIFKNARLLKSLSLGEASTEAVINVEYIRSYYNLKNIRFTLDRNIRYSHYQSNLKINESYNVVEIKSTSDFDFDICYIFLVI